MNYCCGLVHQCKLYTIIFHIFWCLIIYKYTMINVDSEGHSGEFSVDVVSWFLMNICCNFHRYWSGTVIIEFRCWSVWLINGAIDQVIQHVCMHSEYNISSICWGYPLCMRDFGMTIVNTLYTISIILRHNELQIAIDFEINSKINDWARVT